MHVDAGDAGYSKSLKSRHVNMIAIGGAIGTGLFLGAGGRLAEAGPVAGHRLRRLRRLRLPRRARPRRARPVPARPPAPSSRTPGSSSGEKGAYTAGWMYFLNWATTGIADITAVATYTHYWGMFTDVPQWVIALIALAVVLTVNLISVKIFGETGVLVRASSRSARSSSSC